MTTPPLLGIDVNYPVDWAKAKAGGVAWCYVKASEGRSFWATHYRANIAGAKAAGIIPGAYHFLREIDGRGQADWFHSLVGDDYGLRVLDVEWTGQHGTAPVTVTNVVDFCTRWAQLSSRALLIYTGRDFWRQLAANIDLGPTHPLIVAGSKPNGYVSGSGSLAQQWAKVTSTTGGQLPFGGWPKAPVVAIQYTDSAVVPGSPQGTDGDAWTAGPDLLDAYAGGTAVEAATQQEDDMPFVVVKPNPGGQPGDGYIAVTPGGPYRLAEIEWQLLRDAWAKTNPSLNPLVDLDRASWLALAGRADQLLARPVAAVDVQGLASALAPLLSSGGSVDPTAVGNAVAANLAARLAS